jgi:phosphodiesterase/alkaline phosphatase D-like protein
MATWATTNFLGGAIGTAVTTTTEPIFSGKNGTALFYGSGVSGTVQSAEIQSGPGDVTLSLAGKTHVRVGMDVQYVSGAITGTCYLFMFVDGGTVNRADVIVRNVAGVGYLALRNNFVYSGQSTRPFAIGDVYHIELEWTSGTNYKLYQWYPGNLTATPDETYTVANTLTATTVRIGNAGGTMGMTVRMASLRATDGEQIRSGVSGGSLSFNMVGLASHNTVRSVAKTVGATAVRMAVSTVVGMTTPVYSDYATPDTYGYSRMSVSGLAANTQYYWATEVDGVLNTTVNGMAKTLPTPNVAANFSFWSSSCHDTTTSGVFALIKARNPLFGVQLGDMGYPYITGGIGTGVNHNIAPADTAQIIADRELTISAATVNNLYRNVPFSYTYSDCDGGGGNSDGTWDAFVGGNVQAAYRTQFAHPNLTLANCGARSWVVGRVRCVHTDEITLSSSRSAADDASKTKLGVTQKAWFKAELIAARDANQVVFWFGDGPWLGDATTGTDNTWGRYITERNEIGNFITANQIRIVRIHGDTHTLFADDGTHNTSGGFPVISAAPMHTTANPYGETVSNGKYPTVATNSSRQYGFYNVTDAGTSLTLVYHGWQSTVALPTETERVTMTVVWDMTTLPPIDPNSQPWVKVYVGNQEASMVAVGDTPIWEKVV